MREMIIFCGVLIWIAVACSLTAPAPAAARPKRLSLDVHHLGPGKGR
jgi:hypothetical protein